MNFLEWLWDYLIIYGPLQKGRGSTGSNRPLLGRRFSTMRLRSSIQAKKCNWLKSHFFRLKAIFPFPWFRHQYIYDFVIIICYIFTNRYHISHLKGLCLLLCLYFALFPREKAVERHKSREAFYFRIFNFSE